jgi:hypothetical protein
MDCPLAGVLLTPRHHGMEDLGQVASHGGQAIFHPAWNHTDHFPLNESERLHLPQPFRHRGGIDTDMPPKFVESTGTRFDQRKQDMEGVFLAQKTERRLEVTVRGARAIPLPVPGFVGRSHPEAWSCSLEYKL